MRSGLRAVVLASYNSRRRVMRDGGGRVHVSWGAVTVRMDQGEFLGLAALLEEVSGLPVGRGELARNGEGQVIRCAMGAIMVVHGDFTLWFSFGEFEEFCALVRRARCGIEDHQPLPSLGMPCAECPWGISAN